MTERKTKKTAPSRKAAAKKTGDQPSPRMLRPAQTPDELASLPVRDLVDDVQAVAIESVVRLARDVQDRADRLACAAQDWAACFGAKMCPTRDTSCRRCRQCWLRHEDEAAGTTLRDRMQVDCGARAEKETKREDDE